MPLEPIFQQIFRRIQAVESDYLASDDDGPMRSRDWEFIFSDWHGWTVLDVSTPSFRGYWTYPTLYPVSQLAKLKKQLPHYNVSMSSGGYGHISSGDKHWVEPYWSDGPAFSEAELPIYFVRQHYGRPKGQESYLEFNQLITHLLDLHSSPSRNAYCTVDDEGEELDELKILESAGIELILIRTKSLDKLLHLGNWALVRYFEFTKCRLEHPPMGSKLEFVFRSKKSAIIMEVRKVGVDPIQYVDFRGATAYFPVHSKASLLDWRNRHEEKKYAKFTLFDFKNKIVLEDYSLEPGNFANYFTESKLPFETSPVFFKPGVLDKYKHNPDKYDLHERRIHCRGGWYLKTYDINEYGQVHTYAIYLSHLPYKEQLYWLSYNEAPKGGISKRAFQTDFEGKFSDETSELEDLKTALVELGKLEIGTNQKRIWIPKGGSWENAAKGLHVLATENPNEWHDFVIALSNVTIEGLQIDTLREIALQFGAVDKNLRTLGLIRQIFVALKHEELLPEVHAILSELNDLRGKGKAHGAWQTPAGSLVEDFGTRTAKVVRAVSLLTKIFSVFKSKGLNSH